LPRRRRRRLQCVAILADAPGAVVPAMPIATLPFRESTRAALTALGPLPAAPVVGDAMHVFEAAGLGIALIQQRRVATCNQRFAELYGYERPAAMHGVYTREFYANADDFNALGGMAYEVMARGEPYRIELPQRRRNGDVFWARLTGTLLDARDATQGAVWVIDDIDARKTAEATLATVREQHALILDNVLVGVAFLRDRRVTQCNRAFEELLGWAPGELDGRSSREWYFSDEQWRAAGISCYEPFSQGRAFEGEMTLRHRQGHAIECEVRAKAIDPQHPEAGSIWITMDITARKAAERALRDTQASLERQVRERTEALKRTVQALQQKVSEQRQAEARIQRLAHYDALTGLPNRVLLDERAQRALAATRRSRRPLALMFLDLDHFKSINDSLGHRVGDAVLVELAQRLGRVVRAQDTVSRLGGDEFVLLLPDTDAAGAAALAAKVLAAAQVPFQIDGRELTVTPSAGIALAPRDGMDLEVLSRAADAAMYRAKAEGRNTWRFYTAELQAQSDRALLLSNALRRAVERDQLSLVYQPQIEFESGRIVGAEALLRWQHPEFGSVPPVEFIPLAEQSGVILPIGQWVLSEAARQLAAWDREGLPPLKVAVNVSSVQLRQPDLPALVKRTVEAAGLGMHRLELELTEGAAMQDPPGAIAVMNALYENGTELSIDDFGTGYSSLAYLKNFPVGKLKIDRSFVRDIENDAGDRAIVEAIIRMATSLGMLTVAEGVETEAQLAFLRERGCCGMQGWLLSKPLAANDFARFVRARQAD
jgi:diguanylate cyclase (GGDEF)-like protein/PAS domain S-box-containing protein